MSVDYKGVTGQTDDVTPETPDTDVTPETPDTDVTPETPDTDITPDNSDDTTVTPDGGGSSVSTGDTLAPVIWLAALCTVSASTMLLIGFKKKRVLK